MSPNENRAASITSRTFATRRKGFDTDEVRAYLGQVSEIVDRLTVERDEARGDAARSRDELATRPAIDEEQLTIALGEETARVLNSAREAANETRKRSEMTSEMLLRDTRDEVDQLRSAATTAVVEMRAEAEQFLADAQTESSTLREQAEADASAKQKTVEEQAGQLLAAAEAESQQVLTAATAVLDTRTEEAEREAERILEVAEHAAGDIRAQAVNDAAELLAKGEAGRAELQAEGREMVAEAQRVRERMLSDLSRKRKAARVQLEQLQAARDHLLDLYVQLGRSVDAATDGLNRSLSEARVAADRARGRAETEPAATVEQLEEQIAAARDAGLPLVTPTASIGTEAPFVDTGELPAVDVTDTAVAEGSAEGEASSPGLDLDIELDESNDDRSDLRLVVVETETVTVTEELTVLVESESSEGPDTSGSNGFGDLADHENSVEISSEDVWSALETDVPATARFDQQTEMTEPKTQEVPRIDLSEVDQSTDAAALFAQLKASTRIEADAVLVPGLGDSGEVDAENVDRAEARAEGQDTEADVEAEVDELTALLERRDGAVEPIQLGLARKLKRLLADEQSQLLEGLRRHKGRADLDDLLPRNEQLRSVAQAALPELTVAAEEGAGFEGASLPVGVGIERLAEQLASDLLAVVRPKLARCLDGVDDGDDISDKLRATYREWKTEWLVEATSHVVLSAFGEGEAAVRRPGTPIRWVADPLITACADCEDDVLAGAIAAGEKFPTGHAHPPAHPGCRCIIVADRVTATA